MANYEDRDPTTEIVESDSDLDKALSQGPIQPRNVVFKTTSVLVSGKAKSLKFQESWYDGKPWLEYSMTNDEASCFYCRLFKLQVKGN